ncbi:hypothetical protein OH76DRAFT_284223 [Lentinus brumalis]|uniref:Uncharacterized protein n=1 Tax=Lentinus brumalis TaxID=2498619 RepID=A0A371CKQ7_9APHY|nr:hypothetical protein OH76DRAFT_284223 [Polyporus brumalis]
MLSMALCGLKVTCEKYCVPTGSHPSMTSPHPQEERTSLPQLMSGPPHIFGMDQACAGSALPRHDVFPGAHTPSKPHRTTAGFPLQPSATIPHSTQEKGCAVSYLRTQPSRYLSVAAYRVVRTGTGAIVQASRDIPPGTFAKRGRNAWPGASPLD